MSENLVWRTQMNETCTGGHPSFNEYTLQHDKNKSDKRIGQCWLKIITLYYAEGC